MLMEALPGMVVSLLQVAQQAGQKLFLAVWLPYTMVLLSMRSSSFNNILQPCHFKLPSRSCGDDPSWYVLSEDYSATDEGGRARGTFDDHEQQDVRWTRTRGDSCVLVNRIAHLAATGGSSYMWATSAF
eukprot:TRINITY_DN17818_c0_g1_i3.p2 TRINITY_DN17818_c0_g1~~TRINITY_DN17818_c0_g1_i3.p2  ORF type:complete len:129 (-),score=14.01 TRINITY_DN17818_c0_g1_i3:95-481(-)